MNKVIYVVAGGELGDPGFLREQAAADTPAALICADGGARHLKRAGMVPTLIVGDMDSLDRGSRESYEAMGVRIVCHPREKNETDTELALREAFGMAPTEVRIWGALGGRIDHALANLSLLLQGVERGVEVRLIDEWCELFLVTRHAVLKGKEGQTVSLLPFFGEVSGITLRGFEYPLTKATMGVAHPYGISNILAASQGGIEVDSGSLLVVRYFKPGSFPGEERR
jgi:thiamine pyrophosphokinase